MSNRTAIDTVATATPESDRYADARILTLSSSEADSIAALAAFCASPERVPIAGVFFDTETGYAVATDSYRMGWVRVEGLATLGGESFMLPPAAARHLVKGRKYRSAALAVFPGEEVVRGGTVSRVLVSGYGHKVPELETASLPTSYPQWQRLVPGGLSGGVGDPLADYDSSATIGHPALKIVEAAYELGEGMSRARQAFNG